MIVWKLVADNHYSLLSTDADGAHTERDGRVLNTAAAETRDIACVSAYSPTSSSAHHVIRDVEDKPDEGMWYVGALCLIL